MKLKNIIDSLTAKFAALVLTFGLAGGAWAATQVGTWTALKAIAYSSGEFVLTSNIEADGDEGLELWNENSVELDLDGHSISVPADWPGSGLITVDEGSSLTIKGSGMIDASLVEDEWFQAVNNSGSLTIKTGVTIKVDKNVNATALTCEDAGTTIVEDGVVLEGYVYPDGFTFAADGKTVVGNHTVSDGQVSVNVGVTSLSGEGTQADPFRISNLAELKFFRNDVNAGSLNYYSGKYVKLTADIDMENESWTPIGTMDTWTNSKQFKGTFDGDGHVISNLKIEQSNGTCGFFAEVSASTVKNLTISNVSVSVSGGYSAAVAGAVYPSGTIDNCHVVGLVNIQGTGWDVAGIAGYVYGKVINCSIRGDDGSVISGGKFIGGIVGYPGENNQSTITNVSISGVTIRATDFAGGILGCGQVGNKLVDVAVSNVQIEVSTENGSGGSLIGSNLGSAANPLTVEGYSVADVTLKVGGTMADSVGLIGPYNYSNVEGVLIAGFGTSVDPYVIPNLATLKYYRDRVNAGEKYTGKTIQLDADIDLSLDVDANSQQISWVPVGTDANRFFGTFDGNGKTISNLTIDYTAVATSGTTYGGLIGGAQGATVRNVKLNNVVIKNGTNPSEQPSAGYGGRYGAVVGRLYGGTISNCTVTNVEIQDMGHNGGIVGATEANSTIENCKVQGTILIASGSNSGGGWDVGGILGKNNGGTVTITGCTVDGTSAATSKIYSQYAVGGIVGYTVAATITDCTVKNVTVEGSSNAHNYADEKVRCGAGGIMGELKGTISGCSVENVVVKYDDTTTTGAYAAVGLIGGACEAGVTINVSDCTVSESSAYWGETKVNHLDPGRRTSGTAMTVNYTNTAVGSIVSNGITTYYVMAVDAIAAADREGVDEIAIIDNKIEESPDNAWKIDGDKLVRKPFVAQIGTTKYATLEAAIDAAQDGATIEILDGTWGAAEIGTVGKLANRAKSLTIQAASGASPKFTNTILSLGYDDSSTTRNAAITVRGLAFENTMLLIGNYPQVTVEDCSFVGSNGNSSSAGALAIIESCASNYNRDEFILDQVTVRNCTFNGTKTGVPALRVRDSGNVLITGNTIANSNHNGILLESDTTHSRVNTLVSKTVVIQNNTITEWNAGNVADGGRGIRAALGTMAAGSSVTISGNVFRKEQTGFDSPDFVKISDVGSGNTVDISGNDWNNMLLSEVKGNSAIYTSDGTTTLASVVTTRKEPVAQIGANKYETLAAAFAAVQDGETIQLIADVTDATMGAKGIVASGAKTVTLDLAGFNATCTDGSAASNRMIKIADGLTLNVVNTAETKSVMSVLGDKEPVGGRPATLPYGVFRAEVGTTLNIDGGEGRNIKLVNGQAWGLNVKLLGARATLSNIEIESTYGGGIEVSEVDLGALSQTGYAELTDCKFTQTGYYDHCSTALSVSGGSELVVNSGTYTSENYGIYVFSSGGRIVVKDGTFEGAGKAVVIAEMDTNTYPAYTGAVQISGGRFKGVLNVKLPASMSISGGVFSSEVPANYCAEGCEPADNTDAETKTAYPYTVNKYVAQNVQTSEKYFTLAAALDAAQDGQTVKLLADAAQNDGIIFDKAGAGVILDLGSKTFTVNTGANCNNRAFRIDNGTLTVKNGSIVAAGSGTTSSNGAGCYGAFRVEKGGTLNVQDAMLSNSRPWGLNVKILGGRANLERVTINSTYGGGIEVSEVDLGALSQPGYAELTDCTFTQTGYFDHCSTALSVSGGSELVVNSGTYTSENYGLYVFSSGGKITVKGGTITGENKAAVKAEMDTNTYPAYTGAVQISGGRFTGALSVTSPASMSISGGVFTVPVADGYCAVGYEPADNADTETMEAYRYTVAHVKTGYIVEKDNGEGYAVIPTVTEKWMTDNDLESDASVAEIEAELNKPDETTKLKKWEAYVLNQEEPIKIKSIESVGNDDKLTTTLVDAKTGTGLDVTYSLVSVGGESETDGDASGDKSFALKKAEDGSLETGLYKVRVHFKPTGDTSASEVTVDSENTVGVLKTQPTGRFVVVPVPFKELGGNDAPVKVASYIRSGLANGDVLHVYNGSNYDSWTYNGTSWDKTTNMTVNDENTVSTSESAAPSVAALSRGTAAILRRAGSTDTPLVFVGDYTGAAEEQTIAAGWNLVASPSIEAFAPADKFKSGKIQIPGDVLPKNYTFRNGKWGYSGVVETTYGKMPGRIEVETLPAGTGFWYFSDSEQKVEW